MVQKRKSHNQLTDAEIRLFKKLTNTRELAKTRFPIITALFATFGLSCVLFGIQRILDRITIFTDQPIVPVLLGLFVLGATGTIYKKLN